jgi:hypothetical protein
MTEILAVFRSRTQAADFAEKLRTYNVPCTLINTPREANVGCGLSVKFAYNTLGRVKRILAAARYSAFYGLFKIEIKYGKLFILPLN